MRNLLNSGFLFTVNNRFLHANQQQVRVRFAPSPTGSLHLGSLRTALYNYLFAKHHKGSFILRIEDTDQSRLVPTSEDQIHHLLHQYGLNEDEGPRVGGSFGPYSQSKRLDLYREKVEQLIETNQAYRCFCSEDRLSLLRKEAMRSNSIPKYDRKCLSVDVETSRRRAEAGEPYVVRFKLDKQEVSFKDEVFGDVTQCLDESDMVLLKSDGYPTYHLANVVDDRAMQISHVIRGMEWLSSTGKHVALYRAFSWTPPEWMHLSLITRDGKKKLSKRDKDAFVEYYEKELGALPEAVLNLLIRNGSGISDFDANKLYSLPEMVEHFDASTLGRRNLQLDNDCLARSSRLAFQSTLPSELVEIIKQRLVVDNPKVLGNVDDNYLEKVVRFLQCNEEKFAFLSSLTRGEFSWFLQRPTSAEKLLEKVDGEMARLILRKVLDNDAWTLDQVKSLSSSTGVPYSKILLILRLSLIDSASGPPISELVQFFEKRECEERLERMIQLLE